jgi:hypothetical protein
MKVETNRRDVNKIKKNYGVDITKLTTVDELLKAFEERTFKIVMDADCFDTTVHFIETTALDTITFVTDENNTNALVYIGLE